MNDEIRQNPELFSDFLAETEELIETLIEDVLSLEEEGGHEDVVKRVFRTLHTLKGNAGFLNFSPMVDLSHHAEDLVALVRDGQLRVSTPITDCLLLVADLLRNMLEHLRDEANPLPDATTIEARIAGLASVPPGQAAGAPAGPPVPVAQTVPAAPPVPVALPVPAAPSAPAVTSLPAAMAPVPAAPSAARAPGSSTPPPSVFPPVPAPFAPFAHAAGADSEADRAGHAGEAVHAEAHDAHRGDRDAQTVRVDVARIDQIMNQVGELVLERNRLQQLAGELRSGKPSERLAESLADNAGRIHGITAELQAAVLKVRMVPVERIFRKFPRMVRDLAAKLGKEVQFSMAGGDTELDKTVAEAILDPLTHLVRNALDHGIEAPGARRAAGKPEAGALLLSASHEGNHILVRVADDGAGIDPALIGHKAVRLGLATQEAVDTMSRPELMDLLFLPGLTTNESVSEVSGRGVGLDVVRSRLKTYHGMIEILSEPGWGTQVTLKLPLTLAIVPSLFVAVGEDHYAIPLSSVIEVVSDGGEGRYEFQGRPVLRWRDRVLPLLDLRDQFHLSAARLPRLGRKIVVVGLADKQVGFLVDGMVGQEEVVIKTLGGFLGRVPGIAGGTIMGDGHVALIVDIPALVGLARGAGSPAAAA
ncbi:MAG: chemotaxis protein CheA [Candidatus Eisenbacteria bacterium]|nr:chemotaxis protein CheA [Candidatus Eisenbacteria bacterium]